MQLLSQTKKKLFLTVHGDDFTITGRMEALSWICREMENKFEISANVLGPASRTRYASWTDSGITYEPDQRHAESIIKEFNLFESSRNAKLPPTSVQLPSNPVGTPAVPDNHVALQERDSSECMDKHDASRYRAPSARLSYLSPDRPELQFAAKQASRCMATPRVSDWDLLKGTARFLVECPRSVQTFRWQVPPSMVATFIDSDWGDDRSSRKSTSGGVVSGTPV